MQIENIKKQMYSDKITECDLSQMNIIEKFEIEI